VEIIYYSTNISVGTYFVAKDGSPVPLIERISTSSDMPSPRKSKGMFLCSFSKKI
jgi:hypothetical protein